MYHIFLDILDGVRGISRDSELQLISWIPPESKNLSNAEPDIAFCLEVYNTTCGSEDKLIDRCDLTEPRFFYGDHELHSRNIHNITVSPRSNVEGASNGSAVTKQGKWCCLSN